MGRRLGRNQKRRIREELAKAQHTAMAKTIQADTQERYAASYRDRLVRLLDDIELVFGKGTIFSTPDEPLVDYFYPVMQKDVAFPFHPLHPLSLGNYTEQAVNRARVLLHKLDVNSWHDLTKRVYYVRASLAGKQAAYQVPEYELYLSEKCELTDHMCDTIGKRVAYALRDEIRKGDQNV